VSDRERAADAGASLRRGLLAIASLGVVGIWLELAVARHWKTTVQFVPWLAGAVVALGVLLVARKPTYPRLVAARILGVACAGSGIFGVIQHVKSNYDSGELDAIYGPKWATMSTASRLWHAAIESVGPSPSFAPGALALIAACLLLATVRHPAAQQARVQ